MPGPVGTPCNTPEVDSGTLSRTMSNPPGVSISSSTENVNLSPKPKDPILAKYCTSRICYLTFERIRKVYGSLDDIKVEIVKRSHASIDGYVDPVSPKVIHIVEKDPVTIEHELIHVRQYAEHFGNITDNQRIKKLRDMANRMPQEDWVKWNLELEKEAYELSGKSQTMKSQAERRLQLDKPKPDARRPNISDGELKKMTDDSITNFIKFVYEESWIKNWKRLRGEPDTELAPPYIPK